MGQWSADQGVRTWTIGIVGLIALVGGLLRALPVFIGGFPLNDGGLFLSMTADLMDEGFVLPSHASYNELGIPYAYPPMGFYVAGIASALTGADLVDVYRVVPALFSVATIPLAYGIARETLRSRHAALVAAALFAVTPRSFIWVVGGGGATRAPGFFFALLAILLALRMYRHPSPVLMVGTGLALGAAALSHPQAAIFGGLSLLLTVAFVAADRRRALLGIIGSLAVAGAVVAPWAFVVISRHGIDPLVAAAGTGGPLGQGLYVLVSGRTSGGALEIMGVVTSVAIVICLLRRAWLPPLWIIATILVDPRAGPTYAALPASMAVTLLLRDVATVVTRGRPGLAVGIGGHRLMAGMAVILATAVTIDGIASRTVSDSPLQAVGAEERAAMSWVRSSTQPDARFLVISGSSWEVDGEAEWFPVLAQRHSVGTVQGHEWLSGNSFTTQRERAARVLRCAAKLDPGCLSGAIEPYGDVDYLVLSRSTFLGDMGIGCCQQLADPLVDEHGGRVVFTNDAVAIVRLSP